MAAQRLAPWIKVNQVRARGQKHECSVSVSLHRNEVQVCEGMPSFRTTTWSHGSLGTCLMTDV